LVQCEVESARSPLASIMPFSAGPFWGDISQRTGWVVERAVAETATSFKGKHRGWAALTQPAWVEEQNWLRKK
jgi:hypothetical protein